jgi:hypothetical protein
MVPWRGILQGATLVDQKFWQRKATSCQAWDEECASTYTLAASPTKTSNAWFIKLGHFLRCYWTVANMQNSLSLSLSLSCLQILTRRSSPTRWIDSLHTFGVQRSNQFGATTYFGNSNLLTTFC